MRRVIKQIGKDTISTSTRYFNGTLYPMGICLGLRCLCWVDSAPIWIDSWTITMICTEAYYKLCTDVKEDEDKPVQGSAEPLALASMPTPQSKIDMLYRKGNYDELRYSSSKIHVSELEPLGDQKAAMDQILAVYHKKRRACIFLQGETGTGKSGVGLLLAKQLNGQYCHTFDPTTPGDTFENVLSYYFEREDSLEGPLVLVLEEVNVLLHRIHENAVERHKKIPSQVHNKASWCNFLDDNVFYKNVIVILTSNESKAELDALDPAYLREGRINAVIEMKQKIVGS